MTPFGRVTLDASRRMEAMPSEISGWIEAARANLDGLGIHRSQLETVDDLFASLVARQRTMLEDRPAAAASAAYGDAELAFTEELVGAWELWSAFRGAFGQRREDALRPWLDAADLVAADMYRSAMDRAVAWQVVEPHEYREPPLVVVEAASSPATAARGAQATGLSGTIRRYRTTLLPIPMVLLPGDRLRDPWMYATIAHEVGHDLEADLAFTDEAVDAALAALEAAGVPDARRDAWRGWGAEATADAVGVAIAGAGFVTVLADWLASVALARPFAARADDPHPPPHVRLCLLTALLRAMEVPAWAPLADGVDADVADLAAATPAWQADHLPDAGPVARALLRTALGALDGHAIADLAADPAADAARAGDLARYLRTGVDRTPHPAGPPPFPARLVPSAAALAARAADSGQRLADIATRAIDYVHDIPRPAFLAAANAERRAYLRRLGERLDVR